MKIDHREIGVEGAKTVSSEWAIPDAYDRRVALVIAHGAGSDMHTPLISYIHRSMGGQGLMAVRFNFPYKQQGRRAPDPAPRLISTWRRIIESLRGDEKLSPDRLILAGKSLGGRMASMVVAEGVSADGLIFFGYPLHPPKRHDKLRVAHFEQVSCPMLFIQGSRDALCDLDLLRAEVIDKYGDRTTLHIVEGGDHSFKVPKRLGRSEQSVYREMVDAAVHWISDTIVSLPA